MSWVDAACNDTGAAAAYAVVCSGAASIGLLAWGLPVGAVVPVFVGVAAGAFVMLAQERRLRPWLVRIIALGAASALVSGAVVATTAIAARARRDTPRASSSILPTPSEISNAAPPTAPAVLAAAWTGRVFVEVDAQLRAQGIVVERRDVVSPTEPAGTVIAQSVAPGDVITTSVTLDVAVPPLPLRAALGRARLIEADLASLSDAYGYERQSDRGGFMTFSNPATGITLCEGRTVGSDKVADTAVSSFEDMANFGIDHAVGSEITSFHGTGATELFADLATAGEDCGWRASSMRVPRGAVAALHLIYDGSVVKGPIDTGDAPEDWVFVATPNVLIQVRMATEDGDQPDIAESLGLRCLHRLLREQQPK